jgi:hypothetical protein
MARQSAEARGASAFRVGGKPPEVPAGFSPEAAEIWREIVDSKPVDWFDGGSLGLLRLYCRTLVQAERVAVEMESRPPTSDVAYLERRLALLNGCCTTLGTKLRLTVQLQISTKSGKITEKPGHDNDDHLLGGKAIWKPGDKLQ